MIARARFFHRIALLLLLLAPLSVWAQDDVKLNDKLLKMFETPEPATLPGDDKDQECAINLNYIGVGLEMWASDHEDSYPEKLSDITPDYLTTILPCPAAGTDTYSSTYRSDGKTWSVHCSHHHTALGEGYPRANNLSGVSPQEGTSFPFSAAALLEEDE